MEGVIRIAMCTKQGKQNVCAQRDEMGGVGRVIMAFGATDPYVVMYICNFAVYSTFADLWFA